MTPYQDIVFPGGYSPYATAGDCRFDERAAAKAIELSGKYFVHVKGAMGGQPLSLVEWQQDIIGTTFGWKRSDGRRRYRMVYCEIPRGNGKSTMCVVVVGILLFLDDEPGADIFSAAGTRDQSKEVFGPFKENCLRNPVLKNCTHPYVNSITYIDKGTGAPKGVYKAISADAKYQHGGSPHGVIFDELHVQPDRELWDVLWTGAVKRRNPLTVAITTAGFDRESICYEQRLYAEGVLKGRFQDDAFLPVIYAADPEDDWKSPATWRKANPNLGVSIAEEDLARECQRAQDNPAFENTFKRLHLNIWTEQDVRAIPMDQWKACAGDYNLESLRGQTCFAGLDLSSKLDVTAFVLAFPDGDDVRLWPVFWVPEETARQRERQNRTKFDEWIRRGHMLTTPGNSIDHGFIRKTINEMGNIVQIQKIAFDPWNAAQLSTELAEQDGFEMVEFRQGHRTMSEPTKMLLARLADGKLEHPNNPCLNWMASNLAVDEDPAGNLKPSKKKSTEKIDGIVASIMALGLAALEHSEEPQLIIL